MKKKLLSILLAVIMLIASLATLAGCTGGAEIIGVTLPNTSTTLNESIGSAVVAAFPDYKVQVQSAENDVSNQISQIKTFITMGAKMIVVVPTEMEAIEESLEQARAAGIKVVISGATTDNENCYDALTSSNEFLIGSYTALLAKHWVEENMQGKSFDTLILCSDLNDDGIARSNGMQTISEPYLKNNNGEYIDVQGNVVDEANRVENPAYCAAVVSSGDIIVGTMGLGQTGNELISTYLTQYPNIRLVLAYMSGISPQMSQYIVDNSTYNNDEFAIFSGGVQGNESAYLIGSLPSGHTEGVESVFRGAVSFGGADAAQGVADLAYAVFFGTEGVDYHKQTSETIGVWYTVDNGSVPDTLACFTVDTAVVEEFDPVEALSAENTVIKWQNA